MRRLLLLGVALLLAAIPGCGRSFTVDGLGPLELRRTDPGRRLLPYLYRLPDGTSEPNGSGSLFDAELMLQCRAWNRSPDAPFRCLAYNGFVQRHASPTCDSAVFPPSAMGCPLRWAVEFRTEDGEQSAVAVYRERAGEPFDGMPYRWTGAECVPDAGSPSRDLARGELVPAEAFVQGRETERRAVAANLVDVTTTYDDGTVVRQREQVEPCSLVQLEDDPDVRRCVPPRLLPAAPRSSVQFRDAACREPVLFDFGRRFGDVQYFAAVDVIEPGPDEVRERLGGYERLPDGAYALAEDGTCGFVAGSVLPDAVWLSVSDPVDAERFPAYRRIVGEGPVGRVRWVGEDGWATPTAFAGVGGRVDTPARLEDRNGGRDCWAVSTVADGVRCLPTRWFLPEEGLAYLDEDCEQPADIGGYRGTHVRLHGSAPVTDGCDPRAYPISVHRLGPAVDVSAYYSRTGDGVCRRLERTVSARPILPAEDLTSFPELVLEPE